MPLNRYQIRNEYGLADPELYRPADKDDPEALLEGVAMAGLVGVLRQLGDLAEFAAEIFHELHEEVMATAARGHGLMVRVQQLEAEFPSIEKAFLSQTSHSAFFYNTGTGSHPNLRMNQNLITQRDIPRFVMDSYEECRGPPRLFLLDKFDVAGAGACLKRYTDPSFFKALSSEITNTEVQREKKIRKVKKNGSRWRNGETPDVLPPSHAKLHQLFLEERVENGIIDPARRVQLKRRLNGFPFESRTGESYMEKLFKACSPDNEVVHKISNVTGESGLKILGISSVSAEKELPLRNRSPYASNYIEETSLRTSVDELNEEVINGISEMPKQVPDFEAQNSLTTLNEVVYEKEIEVDGGNRSEGIVNGYQSDDIASETDNYMDALTTMDSEMETDEYRANHELAILNIEEPGTDHAHFSDSQSVGNSASSDNGNSSAKQGISSFSYSDSSSMEAESIPSDGDVSGKVFPSTEIYEAEIADMSPDQRSDKDEVPAINTPAHVVSDGAYKSEFGVPSPRSCLTDTAPVLSPSNQGTSLKENSILGPYLNEISADSNEVVTNVNIEENGASVKENSLVEPERDEISSDCKEVVTYTNIEENGTHLEGNTLLGPELDGISSDCNEFVSYANKEENETQLGDSVPSSSDLLEVSFRTRDDSVSTLSAETDPKDELDDEDPNVFYNSALHFSNILDPNPDNECSENLLDDVWQTDTENVVDSQTDSPYSVILRSQEHPVNSVSNELIISDADIKPDSIAYVGDNAIASARDIALNTSLAECSPQSSNCTEQELSEIVGAALPLEINSAQTCTSYSGDKNLDSVPIEIPFHSRNSPDSALDTYVQSDLVVRETVQSQVLAVACSGSVTDNDDKIDSSSLNVTKLQEESLSTDEDSCENQLEISKTCLPDYLEKSDTENQVDHQGVASPDLDSVMSNTVSYDHPESDLLKDDSGSSMAEDADKSLCLGYASTLPLSSDESDKDSEPKPPPQSDLVKNSEDFTPSPDHHLGDPRVPSEQKVELKAGLDVESRQAGKESSDSSFQLDQIQTPLHLDQQRSCDASEISTSSPSIVTNHKLDVPEQAMGSFSSFFPAINLDHEPIQINLEEMPPLPPLPPMQWRLGKIQKISLPSESGSLQQNLGHFPPTFPKAQVGEISQLPNAFSPLSGVRDDRRAYENFGGNLVHSSPFPLQGPNLVDRGNSQQDFFTSGRAQPTNPFLALPTIFNECPGHGVLALEGGTQHPSSKPLSTIKVVEDIASANPPRPSQETSLENEKLRNSAISEEKVVDPPDTTLPPPRMEDEQLSTPLPVSEDEKPNDNQQMKLPRPRSPLVDAVATHDKSKLRKVTERVRPQIGQKVEEKDSLLEQIRTKSFNLKPSVVTRPIIQGPKTNLRVAAILEKAKTIRQAFAGSDEDDDPDSWSDS